MRSAARTRRLLTCGVLAGPLFVGVTTAGVLTRDGFDLRRHGISLLGLGGHGWVQVANFVVAGALSIGFGVGLRRLTGGGAAPLLVWGYGAGLVATGVFLVDPGAGFPPGTPADVPVGTAGMSWHGMIHAAGPPFAFGCLVALGMLFARWFAARGRPGWAVYSVLTAVAALLLIFLPGGAGSVRSALAVVLTSAWLTGLAVLLRRQVPAGAGVGAGVPDSTAPAAPAPAAGAASAAASAASSREVR